MKETYYCNNSTCDKTHCMRHRSRNESFGAAEDKNRDGKFLCPQYIPMFNKDKRPKR